MSRNESALQNVIDCEQELVNALLKALDAKNMQKKDELIIKALKNVHADSTIQAAIDERVYAKQDIERWKEDDAEYYKVWTTKEGKDIPVVKLEDAHLLNIKKHLVIRLVEIEDEIIDDQDLIYARNCLKGWQKVIKAEIKRRGLK